MRYNKSVGRRRKHNKHFPKHLIKKKGWFYYVRVTVEGHSPKWFPLKTQDEGLALQRWASLESRLNEELGFDISCVSSGNKAIGFSVLSDKFFQDVINDGNDNNADSKVYAISTKQDYKRMAKELKNKFGNKPINKLSRPEIIRYHRSLKIKPYEANRRIALLRVILQFAKDEGYISINPADRIKKFKEKKHNLQLEEEILFKKIYPVANPMLKRAIMLAFHLVQHENETKGLKWTDFDMKKQRVSFLRKKTKKPIVIDYSLNPTFITFLEYLKMYRRELSPWLICHRSPKGWVPYIHFRSLWKNALDKAGYLDKNGVPQFKFKEIRHLANTLMKDANISADKRRAMTGHLTNQANEIYTHPTGSDTVDCGKALSRFCPEKF